MASEGGAPDEALHGPADMQEGLDAQRDAPPAAQRPEADGVGGSGTAAASAASGGEATSVSQPPPGEDDVALLPPDHPLLRRAQEALHRQLAEQKLRLEEELRERKKALKARSPSRCMEAA